MAIDEATPSHGPNSDDLSSLTRSVRRLTVAVWCLVGLFAISYVAPWAMFALSRPGHSVSTGQISNAPSSQPPVPEEFDNDFSARPPAEQVKKATVILLTKFTTTSGGREETISEILKQDPKVRFYYKIGDMSPMPYADTKAGCGEPVISCKEQRQAGQVVLLQGNPARPTVSYSYHDDRVGGMGMSLAELRILARESASTP